MYIYFHIIRRSDLFFTVSVVTQSWFIRNMSEIEVNAVFYITILDKVIPASYSVMVRFFRKTMLNR